jgi:hypothetical protein
MAWSAGFSLALAAVSGAWGAPPGNILDLKPWKLALPISSDGSDGASKISAELKQPELDTATVVPWFRDTVMGGTQAVLLRAHANGAKTSSNTKFARSELREMEPSPYASAAWKFKDGKTHTMVVTEAVTALPLLRPQVSVCQIHDANNDVFMLKCEGKTPGTVSENAKLVGYVDNATKGFPIEDNMFGPVFHQGRGICGGRTHHPIHGKATHQRIWISALK